MHSAKEDQGAGALAWTTRNAAHDAAPRRRKACWHARRDNFPGVLGLRVHGALRRACRGETDDDEIDGPSISLWIAFRTAHARETLRRELASATEVLKMCALFSKVCDPDGDRRI